MRPSPERLVIESLLRIPDKEGNDVDFILNQDQAAFDSQKTGRDIIAKYRQGGFSTYPLACALVNCLGNRNRRHVIIAHNSDTTQKLLARIHYMIKYMKGPQPDIKHLTQNRIVFNKTESSIFIGTAGNEDFGVGDTVTDLHCSEVSRWPNAEPLLRGLFQAVPPSGRIVIESTGHGMGNWFHQAVTRAAGGIGYKLHFFHWLNVPEYQVKLSKEQEREILEHPDLSLEEDRYLALGLRPSQLMWRRRKLEEVGYDLRAFKENYPVSLEECFQATGYGIFSKYHFEPSGAWVSLDHWTKVLEPHPMPGKAYCAGADASEGTGRDYSVLEIYEAESGHQVLEYRNNMLPPDGFADRCMEILKRFNVQILNPERNGPGFAFIRRLLKDPWTKSIIYRPKPSSGRGSYTEDRIISDYGTYTTDTNKVLLINGLRKQLTEDITIHSEVMQLELGSFVEWPNGFLGAEKGCFDDTVLGSALAIAVRPLALRNVERAVEDAEWAAERELRRKAPFLVSDMFYELELKYEHRHRDGPIRSQVDWSV